MKVLSLFDGISCGQIALEKAGIEVEDYYASEIDSYAIKIAKKNYPKTIQIGNVTKIDYTRLPVIDLLIGGSPCQGFSIAGKRLEFKDERSSLIKCYFEALEILKPKYFLLENVYMSNICEDYITEKLGVKPIKINSELLSAQNRPRIYWTNIPDIEIPKDKGILLKDILLDQVPEKYNLSEEMTKKLVKRGEGSVEYSLGSYNKAYRVIDIYKKSVCLDTAGGGGRTPYVKINKNGTLKKKQEKASFLTAGSHSGGNHSDMDLLIIDGKVRRYTPLECERLQTLPDNYTEGISDTQRYKSIGNGWTVDIIAHIFSYIQD